MGMTCSLVAVVMLFFLAMMAFVLAAGSREE
jgi:hypothetical protein